MTTRKWCWLALALQSACSWEVYEPALGQRSSNSRAQVVSFRIPAQPMDQALHEFASQAHLQIVFATQDVDPLLVSCSVMGTFTPAEALAALLRGSDLRYTFLNDRTVSVQASVPRSADTKHDGPQT